MDKIKIQGFGDEENIYFFVVKKHKDFFIWLDKFTDLIKKISLSKHIQGVRHHESEDDFNFQNMTDKHESYSAENARIDVFYGKDSIYISVVSNKIKKKKFLDLIGEIADFGD